MLNSDAKRNKNGPLKQIKLEEHVSKIDFLPSG